MIKNKKILLWIAIIIIIAGIIVTAVAGISKGAEFRDMKQVKIYLATDVNIEQVRNITDAVFGDQAVTIQKVELFNDEVSITTENITEEQLAQLIDYTNQEFGLTNSASTTEVTTIPGASLRDAVVPYFLPIALSLVIILIYMGVKAKITDQNILNAVLTPLCWSVLAEGVFFGIMAIFRIPMSIFTMPIALVIMIVALTAAAYKMENIEKEKE